MKWPALLDQSPLARWMVHRAIMQADGDLLVAGLYLASGRPVRPGPDVDALLVLETWLKLASPVNETLYFALRDIEANEVDRRRFVRTWDGFVRDQQLRAPSGLW